MTDQTFYCPNCSFEIEITEVLSNRIKQQVETDFEERKKRELNLALERAESKFGQQLKEKEAQLSIELADLQAQVIEKSQQAERAQQQELTLRKKTRQLEEKQQQLEVEVQRKVDQEKQLLSEQIKKQLDEEFHFKLKEKDKQIEDLRQSVAEVKRKSEVGSQEAQGELLEVDLEDKLRREFPQDTVSPVLKGVRGADLIQEVFDELQASCGQIVWEAKNTKRWSPGWIEKLKDDQRNSSATFAVLVTSVLPSNIERFGQIDGVWVCDMHSYLGLAMALRRHLIDVAFARKASEGKNEKVEMVYQYLSGDEFKHRIEAIVESFNSMQEQLMRERRAMEKIWKEREKQIQRITLNTVGMYGEMRGIIGSGLPQIAALELNDGE